MKNSTKRAKEKEYKHSRNMVSRKLREINGDHFSDVKNSKNLDADE